MCRSIKVLCLAVLLASTAGCGGNAGLAIGQEEPQPDENRIEQEMTALIKEIMRERQAHDAQGLMRRFNQVKTIGCVTGEMKVDAPATHAAGLFATPATYPVTMRLANATQLDDQEADFRGLSLRVHGVTGATGAGGVEGVQDFTMNNHPALVAGTPEAFLDFIEATNAGTLSMLWFLATHPRSIPIVFRGRDNHVSPLTVDYFSTTPYRYGDRAMKYSVKSCDPPSTRVAANHADYLTDALQHELSGTPRCLVFQVQLQTDPDLMPIEDASVEWPEDASPYVSVATISLPVQDVTETERQLQCEQMAFNPWNALPEHRPLGGINRVRKDLYYELGHFRQQSNNGG